MNYREMRGWWWLFAYTTS